MLISPMSNLYSKTKNNNELYLTKEMVYSNRDIFKKSKDISFSASSNFNKYGTNADRKALKPTNLNFDNLVKKLKEAKTYDEVIAIENQDFSIRTILLNKAIKGYMSIHKDYCNKFNGNVKDIVAMRVFPQTKKYIGDFPEIIKDNKSRADAEFLDLTADFIRIYNKYLSEGLINIYYDHINMVKKYLDITKKMPNSKSKTDFVENLTKRSNNYKNVFSKLNTQITDFLNTKLISNLPKGFRIIEQGEELLLIKL